MFVSANGIVLVMDTEYLHGRWFFPCDIELMGYGGLLIRNRISGEVGNDVCVREWACVGFVLWYQSMSGDISIVIVWDHFEPPCAPNE